MTTVTFNSAKVLLDAIRLIRDLLQAPMQTETNEVLDELHDKIIKIVDEAENKVDPPQTFMVNYCFEIRARSQEDAERQARMIVQSVSELRRLSVAVRSQ